MGKILSVLVTQDKIKIAQLTRGSKGAAVHRFLSEELPADMVKDGCIRDTEGFAQVLKRMLKNAGIRTKKVIFSLPSDRVMTREAVLPDMSREKTKAAIRLNASDYFPINLADCVLSYFPLTKLEEVNESKGRKSKRNVRLMIMAAPNELVQSYYDAAKAARLQVVSVEYQGNSALQLALLQIREETCLVLQINSDDTVMTLFQNKKMLLQRHIDFGSSLLLTEQDTVVQSVLHELAGQLQRTLEYYAEVKAAAEIEQIYLLGEEKAVSGMEEILEQRLGCRVKTISGLNGIKIKDRLNVISSDQLRANLDIVGAVLAPRGFLPRKLEQDLRVYAEARACRIMVLAAVLVALLNITMPAVEYFQTAIETMEVENQLLLTEDMRPALEEYRQARSHYEDARSVWSFIEADSVGIVEFVSYLEQLQTNSTFITSFSYDRGQINLSVLTYGKEAATEIIQQLNEIEFVSEVRASSLSSSFSNDRELVSFSLSCQIVQQEVAK